MTALTSKWLKVIKASEQPVLGFQETTLKLRRERVYPRLIWWWSFLFPPNSQEPPLQNIYILLHKLLRELQWEREGARKDMKFKRVPVLLHGAVIAAGTSHQPLTFKLYYLTLWNCIPTCSISNVSSPSHFTWNLCECVLRDGRWGDVYDPLRRRKNKQKRNEEEEEEERRRRNNKNRKEVFPCFLQLFSHGKGTGYPTQLVTIEWTSLVGSGIDNLCLLSYTS